VRELENCPLAKHIHDLSLEYLTSQRLMFALTPNQSCSKSSGNAAFWGLLHKQRGASAHLALVTDWAARSAACNMVCNRPWWRTCAQRFWMYLGFADPIVSKSAS
jgi:hypothetical protein